MLSSLAIYGPDGAASWDNGDISIGRRLSRLVPEDVFDRSPAKSAGGRYRVVADARLDDRAGLARLLAISNELCDRVSDACLIALAWERWGAATPDRLYGDFAVAVWDARDRVITLARDPIGMRPLHFFRNATLVAFASMPRGLHALPEIPYAVDEAQVARQLALMPEAPGRSFFAEIARVDPGHMVTLGRSATQSRRYWLPTSSSHDDAPRDAVAAVRELFDSAVRTRLRGAEKAVATHLSGGLDSAGVTATAARILDKGSRLLAYTAAPRQGYDLPVRAGCVGDESVLAEQVAARYPNIDHRVIRTPALNPIQSLDRSFLLNDRPALNVCNVGWHDAIDAAARAEGAKILLTGAMGNLTLSHAGLELLPQLLGRGRLLSLWTEISAATRSGTMGWRSALYRAIGPWLPRELDTQLREMSGRQLTRLEAISAVAGKRLEELRQESPSVPLPHRRWTSAASFQRRLETLGRNDPGNYIKGNLANHGIDHRDPTADRALVEYCLALPPSAFFAGGRARALARNVLSDRLPPAILDARLRGEQAVDWHEPLSAARRDIGHEIDRASGVDIAARALDLPRLRALVDNWPNGGWHEDAVSLPYRFALLRGIAAAHFIRKVSRTNS